MRTADEVAISLLNALGISHKNVTEFDIKFKVNEPVRMVVRHNLIDPLQLDDVGCILKKLTCYELTEITNGDAN